MDFILYLLIALLPACETESSSTCYWNAAESGNMQGTSFVDFMGMTFTVEGN